MNTSRQESQPRQSANLVYFENWVDSIALTILAEERQLQVQRLRYDDPLDINRMSMRSAHGYQIAPRGELRTPWFADRELLDDCPQLLAISSTGAGYDMIDVQACTRAGVIVCNQSGSNSIAVAEHTVGLMLGIVHRLNNADRALRSGRKADRFALAGSDLSGKVVGLVGLGHIGTRVAALCKAFGMRVLAYDPYLRDEEIGARGAESQEFLDLLRHSDIVSLHCPLTSETLGMFNLSAFAQMKAGAYFVSTARGGIHDEDALYTALASEHLAGAGLDVFLAEPPLRSHPLLSLDNVIATPHNAGLTKGAVHSMASYAATQWVEIFNGRVPPRLVNPEAWLTYSARFSEIFGFAPARPGS